VYANRAFIEETSADLCKAGEFIINIDFFLENIRKLQPNSIHSHIYHPKKGTSKWKVKSQDIGNGNIGCIFSRISADDEVLHYWKQLDDMFTISALWFEYHEEVNDIFLLHVTKKNAGRYEKPYDEVIGHYMVRDLGIRAQEIEDKLPALKQAEREGSAEVCTETMFPTGKLYGIYRFLFLGYSDGEKRRPQFLLCISDSTDISRMVRELEEKKQVINNLSDEVSSLERFFNVSPPMGIIDLEGESFRYVVVNPSAAAILGKTPMELKGKRPEECGIGESIALEFAQKNSSFLHKYNSLFRNRCFEFRSLFLYRIPR